jgi:hypothetical protein
MTYPSGSGTISNNWGPALPTANGGDAPVYPPTATPSPTASTVAPQSPSGSVTNQAATWNFANTESSTRFYLDSILNVDSVQWGTPALTHSQIVADVTVNVSSKNLVNLGT